MMSRQSLQRTSTTVVVVGLLCWSGPAVAQGTSCLQNSSQAPTVAAVQGTNDLRAINVASQFLTGCGYDAACRQAVPSRACDCPSEFHVPASWPCIQLHVDTQFRPHRDFYRDESYASAQQKSDVTRPDGLESYPIVFYAGEGVPEHFDAWPGQSDANQVNLATFSLGNVNVRYLFMLSCNLFAHGPRVKGTAYRRADDFTAPQDFDPAKVDISKKFTDPDYMADAFHRWGRTYVSSSPLNVGLRLACGGSSRIGNTPFSTHRFWYYFSVQGWRPADAFLAALFSPEMGEVPLCISRGDSLQESGLDDPRFEFEPLTADPLKTPKSIFIEFPERISTSGDPLVEQASHWAPVRQGTASLPQGEPPLLPVLSLGLAPLPHLLGQVNLDGPALEYGFRSLSASAVKANLDQLVPADPVSFNFSPDLNADDLCVKRHPDSGSLVVSWRPAASAGVSPVSDSELDKASNAVLVRLLRALPLPTSGEPGFDGPRIAPGETIPIQMRIRAAPAAQNGSSLELRRQEISHIDGCFYVLENQVVHVEGVDVPILGEGSESLAARCPVGARRVEPRTPPTNFQKDACRRTDPPLATFVYNNRIYTGNKRFVTQKTIEQATPDAWAFLGTRKRQKAYNLVRVRWGYRAAPVHCKQDEMYLFYQFDFLPKNLKRYRDLSPVTVEVPAHSLPGERQRFADTLTCSPERPPE